MEIYGWTLLCVSVIIAIYTLLFARDIWNNKNKLGACFVALLAMSIVAIPFVTIMYM